MLLRGAYGLLVFVTLSVVLLKVQHPLPAERVYTVEVELAMADNKPQSRF